MGELSEKDLLLEGKRSKPKGEPRKHLRKAAAAKSIPGRPPGANDHTEYRHWEADTIVSGTGTSSTCLLTPQW